VGRVPAWVYVLLFFATFFIALSVFTVLFGLGVLKPSWFDFVSSLFTVERKVVVTKTFTETVTRTVTVSPAFPREFGEVVFSRTYIIRDFTSGREYVAAVSIPASMYFNYRLYKKHEPMTLSTRINYVKNLVEPDNQVVRVIANDLWGLANGDPELYAVFVLQLLHQMVYRKATYAKYPVETLVEWSGDCDNLAVLAASILEAKGVDTVLVMVKTEEGYHVMLGIHLPFEPKLPGKYGRSKILYFTTATNPSRKYYAAEATWKFGVNPFDPHYTGTLLGDSLWKTFKIVKVIDV